jgi:hypothetical protein
VFPERVRAWITRSDKTVNGFAMVFLWVCIGIATPFLIVKIGLAAPAMWKLIQTLNGIGRREEDAPHVGGGITSSAATAHDLTRT